MGEEKVTYITNLVLGLEDVFLVHGLRFQCWCYCRTYYLALIRGVYIFLEANRMR